ncbi:MAG: YceD family protein [Gammaproteobacteria bacterium]
MDKLGRLMSSGLPQTIEPLHLAKEGKQIAGQYELRATERLSALLYEDSGRVSFELEFTRDEENALYCITGYIEASLILTCQRCLGRMELNIKSSISLGIVSNKDEEAKLATDYEPLMLTDEPVSLLKLIEDELLLATPFSPMHDEEHCKATALINEQYKAEKNKPFAELEKLKQRIHK